MTKFLSLQHPSRGIWLGSAAALFSAISFSLNVTCARFVYDTGGNIHAVNLVRPLVFLLCLSLWLWIKPETVKLPSRRFPGCIALGILLLVELYALLGAIHFIQVALAVLILYTYPLMVAVVGWLRGRDKVSPLSATAMLVAFGGLALALQVPADGFDPRGVILSVGAAVALASIVVISEPVMEGQDNRVVMLYMTITLSVMMVLFSVAGLPLQWPTETAGWFGLAGTAVFFVLATFLLFTAVSLIGPLRTAVIDTSSPVWAILFGFLLLGQTFSPIQMIGAALIISSIVFVQIDSHRKSTK